MNAGYTHICLVLPSSIEMREYVGEIKTALTKFAETQRQSTLPGEKILVDGYKFGAEIQRMFHNATLDDLPESLDSYKAYMGVSFYIDAGCTAIDELDAYFSSLPEKKRPKNVLFVFVENFDKDFEGEPKFRVTDFRKRVKSHRRVDNWRFMLTCVKSVGYCELRFGSSGDLPPGSLTHNDKLFYHETQTDSIGENLYRCLTDTLDEIRHSTPRIATTLVAPPDPDGPLFDDEGGVDINAFDEDDFNLNFAEKTFVMDKTEDVVWDAFLEFRDKYRDGLRKENWDGELDLLKDMEKKIQTAFSQAAFATSRINELRERHARWDSLNNKFREKQNERRLALYEEVDETISKYLEDRAANAEIDALKGKIHDALYKFENEKFEAVSELVLAKRDLVDQQPDELPDDDSIPAPVGPTYRCADEINAILAKYEPLRNYVEGLGYEDDEEVMRQREAEIQQVLTRYQSFDMTPEELAIQKERERKFRAREKALQARNEAREARSKELDAQFEKEQELKFASLPIWGDVLQLYNEHGGHEKDLPSAVKQEIQDALHRFEIDSSLIYDETMKEQNENERDEKTLRNQFAEFRVSRVDAENQEDDDSQEWEPLFQSELDRLLARSLFYVDDDYLDDAEAFRQCVLDSIAANEEDDEDEYEVDGDD